MTYDGSFTLAFYIIFSRTYSFDIFWVLDNSLNVVKVDRGFLGVCFKKSSGIYIKEEQSNEE